MMLLWQRVRRGDPGFVYSWRYMKQRMSSPRKAQLLLDCTLGGKTEGERSVFRVRAPGLGPLKGPEAGLNSGGVLQPSAGQERSSLDGGREGSAWLPPGSLLLFLSVATGLWPLGFLGFPGREVTKFPLLSGNVLQLPLVFTVSAITGQEGDSWPRLRSQNKLGSRTHFSSLHIYTEEEEGEPFEIPGII